jgi:hypothetical protein
MLSRSPAPAAGWLVASLVRKGEASACCFPMISDNYFCRLATITFAGGSAVRTACATVGS